MEIQVYNPYTSHTLAERLLTRRLPSTITNRLQNNRVLHRRQNRFRNLNRFGEQEIIFNFDDNFGSINFGNDNLGNDNLIFIKNDATIKIQRWYKRYNLNKLYLKSIQFIDR